jgi:SP family myo-inositol transporter-like MFS transporter 13
MSMILLVASYAIGLGLVVWLLLSELMPTRIRAVGSGHIDSDCGSLSSGVGDHGYTTMFLFWAVCTLA